MKQQLNRTPQMNLLNGQSKQALTKRNIGSLLTTASLCMSLCISLAGCSEPKKEIDPRLDPPLVPVTKLGRHNDTLTSYTGTVKARVESNIGFRVGGKITQRLVDVGQPIKRGQALFRLDPTDLSHAVTAKEESVESQINSVESKQGNLEAARARLVQAESDEQRYKNAAAVGVVTDQAYDQYKAAAESARAYFKAAQADVKAATDQASALMAQKKVAQNESDYSTLFSDADGVVTDIMAEPGQVVAVGQSVAKIAHCGPREASISLPETVRPPIGQTVEAQVYDTKIPVCKARLRQLSQAADPLTRTFEARYVLSGQAANAPLGSTVAITIESSRPQKLEATVPLTALVDKGRGTGVWTVDLGSSVVHFRAVTVSVLGNEDAVIVDGLKPGEMFVSQGAHLLHENAKVRIAIAGNNDTEATVKLSSKETE